MTLLRSRLQTICIGTLLLALVSTGLVLFFVFGGTTPRADGEAAVERHNEAPAVKVVKPVAEGMERTTTQPGTVRAFEHEELYAKVAGLLENQQVDIGSVVKKGDVLAEIEAPEYLKEEEFAGAKVKQARSQVEQMRAFVAAAKAEVEAAKILIEQKQAEVKRARSYLSFREKQYERVKQLADDRSVDQRLVDEQYEHLESSQAWRDAAEVGVKTARADVMAKEAKLAQAEADLKTAEVNVEVAEAARQKAHVFVEFTKIRSHYNGVVTTRNYHNGDYIRPADHGERSPLLVVQRTDLMRVVVQLPDSDVPFCLVGCPVDLTINTLPGVKFPSYKVSRMAHSQDQSNRTMRVEVDVPNDQKLLRDGMYGDVTIHLRVGAKDAFRVPSAALTRRGGKLVVFAVRGDVISQVPVTVGLDNGSQAEVLSGLKADDLVVVRPDPHLRDGQTVRAEMVEPEPGK
jgi:RND family efflux transporter MFP subunit